MEVGITDTQLIVDKDIVLELKSQALNGDMEMNKKLNTVFSVTFRTMCIQYLRIVKEHGYEININTTNPISTRVRLSLGL